MDLQRIIFILLLYLTIFVSAQEGENTKMSLGGYVQLDHISFFKEKDEQLNRQNQGIFRLELSSKSTNSRSFFSAVEIKESLYDKSQSMVYLKELYMDIFLKHWDLRLGKQIFSWGKADGFNPMNTLGTIDYTDVLDTENKEIGIFALNGKLYLGEYEFQTVYSPIFTASILPTSGSRWQFELPSFINIEGNDYNVDYNMEIYKPTDKLKNGTFAVKLSRNFSRLDLSFSYFNGYNHIPAVLQQVREMDIISNSYQIDVLQKYYRHQVVSSDFSLSLNKYVFKGEGGLYLPKNTPNDKPYFQYVVGVDRTFSRVFGNNDLFLILQWMHELKNNKIDYSGRDLNHLFQENVMCRLEMEFTSTTQVSLQGIYAVKYEEFYLKPQIRYNLSDELNLSIFADLLGGNKNKQGTFSGYSDNSRVQMKLKYSF